MKIQEGAVKAVAVVLVFLLLVLLGLYLVRLWETHSAAAPAATPTPPVESDGVGLTYYEGSWYAPRKGLETVLLMGLDVLDNAAQTESYTNHQQADFLLLLLLDHDDQTFVRTRRELEDSSNLRRMERQRQYMAALLEQLQGLSVEDPKFLSDAALTLSEYLVSDCTVNQLSDLGTYVQSCQFTGIQALEGEAVEGEEYMEFYVDEDAMRHIVMELFYAPQP